MNSLHLQKIQSIIFNLYYKVVSVYSNKLLISTILFRLTIPTTIWIYFPMSTYSMLDLHMECFLVGRYNV